jgi:hypothetical protein
MDVQIVKQKHYLASKQVKKLQVRRKGGKNLHPLHHELVEISSTTCCFEKEGRQEFRVGEEVDFIFDTEECCLSTGARIVWVTKFEHIDEGYEHIVWFSYGAEFSGELDGDFFQRIKGDPKRTSSLTKNEPHGNRGE